MRTGSFMITVVAICFTVSCGSADRASPPVADAAPKVAKQDVPLTPVSALPTPTPPVSVGTTSTLPDAVKQFVARRDECEHFIGEEGYDAERQRYLNEAVAQTCTGTDKQLAELRATYAGDPVVTERLKNYDADIEAEAPPPPSGNDE